MTTTTAIDIKDLSVRRAGAEVLSNVSISIYPGELVALFGSNGAGKSTLLEAVMGLLPTHGGQIQLSGLDVTALSANARAAAGIAFVPQSRRIFPSLTARENLLVGCRKGPRGRRALLHMVIESFPELRPHLEAPAWQLSGGLQQILAFGRALMGEPRVLLLDEPMQGMAPTVVRGLWASLAAVAGTGTAILMAEQNIASALSHATYACFVAQGRVARFGPASEFNDMHEIAALLLGR